ncbi:plasmid pRiA4b ORF-3 family protein [Pseudomonas atacamensis]|nr:plasmid pRiA4b ORF-3 family protein [Pseudomonas atacamensis]
MDGAYVRLPEDIAGAPGYEEFLATFADPNHPKH